jgi:hypothetical protein
MHNAAEFALVSRQVSTWDRVGIAWAGLTCQEY